MMHSPRDYMMDVSRSPQKNVALVFNAHFNLIKLHAYDILTLLFQQWMQAYWNMARDFIISNKISKYQQISIPNYSYELYAEVNILVCISDYPITANGCEKHLILKMLMKTWDEYFYVDALA